MFYCFFCFIKGSIFILRKHHHASKVVDFSWWVGDLSWNKKLCSLFRNQNRFSIRIFLYSIIFPLLLQTDQICCLTIERKKKRVCVREKERKKVQKSESEDFFAGRKFERKTVFATPQVACERNKISLTCAHTITHIHTHSRTHTHTFTYTHAQTRIYTQALFICLSFLLFKFFY